MDTLPLSPLPFEISKESRRSRQIESEGFVDEVVVSRVIERGVYERSSGKAEGMVLCSNAEDYAGWTPTVESPFRNMAALVPAAPAKVRAPDPAPSPAPASARPWQKPLVAIEEPYQGGHRWWLIGISGAIACAITAVSLFSLAQRRNAADLTGEQVPAREQPAAPAAAASPTATAPSLTKALPEER